MREIVKAANDNKGEIGQGKNENQESLHGDCGTDERRNSQVALSAIRAPAKVVLKMLARHARTLLEDVARNHVLLVLRVPARAWGPPRRRERRRSVKETRRFGGVGRVGVRRRKCGRGCTVSYVGRWVRLVVRVEVVAWYELRHRDYEEYGEAWN